MKPRPAPDAGPRLTPIEPRRFPRPNPDPVAWPTPVRLIHPSAIAWLAGVLATGVLLIAIRRRQVATRTLRATTPTAVVEPRNPRQRLSELSEVVRQSLAGRLGPGWTSLTTEEIAAHPALDHVPQADRLRAFLRAADQAKFADVSVETGSLEDWESWVAQYLSSALVNS